MLVLTRNAGQSIIIGTAGEITVTVIKIKGSQVSIGVDAPKDVPVNREEIHLKILADAKRGAT